MSTPPPHAFGAILEELNSRMGLVMEAVLATREELHSEIGGLRTELRADIARLQTVVMQNTEELQGMRQSLDAKADAARVAALEHRVTRIESA